jgi:GNAT superfamily N-acetyltransferase
MNRSVGCARGRGEWGRQEVDDPLPPAESPPTTSFPWFTAAIVLLREQAVAMKPYEVRAPRSDELRQLAQLKIDWAGLDPRPDRAAEWTYADELAAWMDRMGDRVICRVAVSDGTLIGMAWLVVFERVPDFVQRKRRTGDLQSVYVVPAKRGHGVGLALVDALTAESDRRGIPRLTVHSSSPGIALYEAAGFHGAATLLHRDRPADAPE